MSLELFKERFGYEIGEVWMPRVTAITSILNKPNLLRYFAESPNYMAAQRRMDTAAEWGTLTHETIGRILRGQIVRPDPRIAPSIRAFVDWKEESGLKLKDPERDIERLLVDRANGFAGTADIVAEVRGERGVVDIKTSSGIWEEHYLQTAAYLLALNRGLRNKSEARWILRVDQYRECVSCAAKLRQKEGTARVRGGRRGCYHRWGETKGAVEFKRLEGYNEDAEAFLAAKRLWEWYYRKFLSRIENYPGQ